MGERRRKKRKVLRPWGFGFAVFVNYFIKKEKNLGLQKSAYHLSQQNVSILCQLDLFGVLLEVVIVSNGIDNSYTTSTIHQPNIC